MLLVKQFFATLKKAWKKWWVKWPAICMGVPLLLLVVYLLSFNTLTLRKERKFLEKWEPIVGSLKKEDVVPLVPKEEDLYADPLYKRVQKAREEKGWVVMSFLGREVE